MHTALQQDVSFYCASVPQGRPPLFTSCWATSEASWASEVPCSEEEISERIMNLFKRFRKKNDRPKEIKEAKPAELPPAYTSDWSPEQTEQVIAETTNAAFIEAWRMHWIDLDESERVEWSFREVKSPLKVQKTIEDMDKLHREHSISRKIAAKTLRFLQALETLMSGVAIGIQSYPDVSAIVVGVVRVVINVS